MDVVSKTTGNNYSAAEFNQSNNELENALSSTGQIPATGDLFQIAKAMADYAAHGDFYTDSGIADAYVLNVLGSKQRPTTYGDGFRARFEIVNTNTGASTVNIDGIGVKNIKNPDGTDPIAGTLIGKVTLQFDSSNDYFIIYDIATGATVTGVRVVETKNISSAVQTVTFSNLDGDRDIEYTIKGRIVNDDVSVSQMSMRLNADSGANYALQETKGVSTGVTVKRLINQNEILLGDILDISSVPGLNTYEITIFAKSGELRICGILIYEGSAITGKLSTVHSTGVWGNSGSNLISIEISSDQASGIGVGSYLELTAK